MISEKSIIDIIIKCAQRIRFHSYDKQNAINQLYLDAIALFQYDKNEFDTCTKRILIDDYLQLHSEEYMIKLECAGLYHKNSVDAYIFRIRYYLGIATDWDEYLLGQKILSAYTVNSNSANGIFNLYDSYSPYEKLFRDVFYSNDKSDAAIKNALNHIWATKLSVCYECIVPYVHICQITNKAVPTYLITIFILLTEIPAIQCDGLQIWIKNNPDSYKKALEISSALDAVGMEDAKKTFNHLKQLLKNKKGGSEWNNSIAIVEKNIFSISNKELTSSVYSYYQRFNNRE